MYTLPRDYEIDARLIRKIIDYGKSQNDKFNNLKNYYLGHHDICKRDKDGTLKNNKVMINHAKYIVDTNVGYLLGNPVEYQASEEFDIQPLLDIYKKNVITDLDVELCKDIGIYGVQYEYIYAGDDSLPKSVELDNRNIVLVKDDTVEHKELFAIMYRPVYKGEEKKDKIQYWDVKYITDKFIRDYRLEGQNLTQVSEDIPHVFKGVPVIEYKNNPEMLGDFETVISLIDAYNLLQSDRVNDKEQLVDAILCFYGVDFQAEQTQDLKEHRVISRIPVDGKVEYLVKQLNEADTDVLRQTIEADIHKISMVPNITDQNFVGNASGVAIRYKLLGFEQNIKNKERYFEKGLMKRFELYNNFLSTKSAMAIVPKEEVDVIFKRNLPSNDFEISQMINNLSGIVDKETLVGQLSFIKDAKEIVELAEKENEVDDKTLNDDVFKFNDVADAARYGVNKDVKDKVNDEKQGVLAE